MRRACIAEKRASRVTSHRCIGIAARRGTALHGTARSRCRRESTRARNLACGKCRNVRNKTLPGRSGRCSCTGPLLRSTMGTVHGSTPSCLETPRVPCVSISHTRYTHAARSSPSRLPWLPPLPRRFNHPTFLAAGPLLLPPRSPARLRYHSNSKISEWTSTDLVFSLFTFSSTLLCFLANLIASIPIRWPVFSWKLVLCQEKKFGNEESLIGWNRIRWI